VGLLDIVERWADGLVPLEEVDGPRLTAAGQLATLELLGADAATFAAWEAASAAVLVVHSWGRHASGAAFYGAGERLAPEWTANQLRLAELVRSMIPWPVIETALEAAS